MLPKPPRLLDSEGHQAMLATDRGHGFRIVRELPGLGLRCSQAGFVKASGSQHGKAEDGGDSGIDEEVPVPAVVVEPGDVARAVGRAWVGPSPGPRVPYGFVLVVYGI